MRPYFLDSHSLRPSQEELLVLDGQEALVRPQSTLTFQSSKVNPHLSSDQNPGWLGFVGNEKHYKDPH